MKLSLRRPLSTALAVSAAAAVLASLCPRPAHAAQDGTPAPNPAPATAQPAPVAPAGPAAPTAGPDATVTGTAVVVGSPTVPKDAPAQAPATKSTEPPKPAPFRGSTFIFDQSMSTATAHLEPTPQQSYIPLYTWWLSFRPRYNITDKLAASARFDFYKELTNTSDTTYFREDVFGDIWLTLSYGTPLATKGPWRRTRVGLSGNVILPTSKASQARGLYTTLSGGPNIRQVVPLRDKQDTAFSSLDFSLSASYSHPFTRSTTADGLENTIPRQDLNGRPVQSNDISGRTMSNHRVLATLGAGVAIVPKLHYSLSMIVINGWNYAPKEDITVQTATGPTAVPRSDDSTLFVQSTWFNTSIDYDPIDELSLSLGYYNQAGVLAANGQRRGVFGGQTVWWSPDARVFLTMTANLDAIYKTLTGSKGEGTQERQPTRQTTRNTVTPTPFLF